MGRIRSIASCDIDSSYKLITMYSSHGPGHGPTKSPQKKTSESTTCPTGTIPLIKPPSSLSTLLPSHAETMVLKIRLARFGKRNAPFYNIVVAQARFVSYPFPFHPPFPYTPPIPYQSSRAPLFSLALSIYINIRTLLTPPISFPHKQISAQQQTSRSPRHL